MQGSESLASSATTGDERTIWRPVAYVAVRDDGCRREIAEALHGLGWPVIESRTGYHLLQSMSGPLFGDQPWLHPGLVVADAAAIGCSGITIARGLRELGWSVPVVLLRDRRDPTLDLSGAPDDRTYLLDADQAAAAVAEIALRSQATSITRG